MAHRHVKALRSCGNLIFCSNALAKEWLRRYDVKAAAIIPNGVEFPDTARDDRWEQQGLRFVTTCQIIPRKNVKYLCDIFTNFDSGTASLTVVGGGPKIREITAYRGETITFTGHQTDVYPWLTDSDVFISSSLSEGLPNSVLEALSVGIPCILSDIGPHLELKKEMPRCVEIFSLSDGPDVAARKILGHAKRLSTVRAVEIRSEAIRRYSAENMSRSYQALYDRTLDKGGVS